MRHLYDLLFYKIYKFGNPSRRKADSSCYTAWLIGLFLVLWIINLLAAINLYDDIPGVIYVFAFLISIPANVIFIMRKKKYEQIINEMESKKLPLLYHITVYLLLAWTFIGIVFL